MRTTHALAVQALEACANLPLDATYGTLTAVSVLGARGRGLLDVVDLEGDLALIDGFVLRAVAPALPGREDAGETTLLLRGIDSAPGRVSRRMGTGNMPLRATVFGDVVHEANGGPPPTQELQVMLSALDTASGAHILEASVDIEGKHERLASMLDLRTLKVRLKLAPADGGDVGGESWAALQRWLDGDGAPAAKRVPGLGSALARDPKAVARERDAWLARVRAATLRTHDDLAMGATPACSLAADKLEALSAWLVSR